MIALADAIDADVLRIRYEFLEMPGLVRTVAQTARLYAVSTAHAKTLLETLEAEGVPGQRVHRRLSALDAADVRLTTTPGAGFPTVEASRHPAHAFDPPIPEHLAQDGKWQWGCSSRHQRRERSCSE